MAEFIVTMLEDEDDAFATADAPGGEGLSLREAIELANNSDGADTITFADGLEGTIRLTEGRLRSEGDLSIDGDGRIAITGDALGNDVTDANGITDVAASKAAGLFDDNGEIIRHDDGDLTLDGLTLTGGSTLGGGGAVRAFTNTGPITVTFIDTTVSGNYARFDGGGTYAEGDIDVQGSVFSNNVSGNNGGGIASAFNISVTDSEVINNVSDNRGGGISAEGDITITNSILADNETDGRGGGAYADGDFTSTDSVIRDNAAIGGGGGATGYGSFTIERTLVSGNTSEEGTGGILGATNGTREIIDSVIIGNSGLNGGVSVGSVSINVTGSLFQDNVGTNAGAVYSGLAGTFVNSTFVGNSSGAKGGAINVYNATLDHVTITGNTTTDGEGAVSIGFGSTIANSIITGNIGGGDAGPDLFVDRELSPISDAVTFFGSNIIGEDDVAFGSETVPDNVINAAAEDIFVSEVLDNGGPTPTLALLANAENPAIDADSVTSQLADARGEDRAVDILGIANGGDVDLGAFEFQRDEAPNPFEVTTLDDVVDLSDGLVSLREAILAANATPGLDVITFANDLDGTIRLTEGTLTSGGDLTIDGDGRIAITGDALGNDITDANGITDVAASQAAEGDLLSDNVRVIEWESYSSDTLVIDGLTITGGYSDSRGGGISARRGLIEIVDSEISGNFAREGGGVSAADVTIENSVLSGNVASGDGGAVYGTDITVTGGVISGNTASGSGGGLYADDYIFVYDAVISGNKAVTGGGVVGDEGIEVTDSVISNNTAELAGGIYVVDGDISVTGTELSGNVASVKFSGAYAFNGGFSARDSIIRDNSGDLAVFSDNGFFIIRTVVSGNTGGGVGSVNFNSTVIDSVFSENTGGSAINTSGSLSVTGSLFQDNTGSSAGAIYASGFQVTVTNSTFVGNTGESGAGAISVAQRLALDHVTITGNTSSGDAAAVDLGVGDSTATITNSIITGNSGGPDASSEITRQGGSAAGSITFSGNNIVGADAAAYDTSGEAHAFNAAAEDIFVTVVEDNGGPTPTLALLASEDNFALDASDVVTQIEDARGTLRPRDIDDVDNGGAVDLGAFELNVVNLNGVGIVDEGNFGAEEILGTDDNDTLKGGPSFEDSVAGSGQDTIRGFGGDDLLDGEGGADLIFGGLGDDTIIGGQDIFEDREDTIFGGDGDDDINGGVRIDEVFGGDGDDIIRVIGDDEIDDVDGGGDIDTLDLSATDDANAHTVDLESGDFLQLRDEGEAFVIRAGSIANVENVVGGAGNDRFVGNDQANRLEGGDGDDTLLGQDGDDVLEGGDGADLLEGGDGDDTLIGGEASNGDEADTLFGGDGDDVFDGGFFTDQIFGGAGDDTILINENDRADDVDGGVDIDTIDHSGARADLSFKVNLATGEQTRVEVGLDFARGSVTNVENLIGSSGADEFTGDDQANRLEGGGDDDTLIGGGGDDTLLGGDHDDRLAGGAGVNTVDGGEGEDAAAFAGAFADYVITLEPSGSEDTGPVLKLTRTGIVETEEAIIRNVEQFAFADQTISLADLLAPTANDDTFETDEDATLTVNAANGVLANDADIDSASLTVELLSDVSNGSLVLNPDGSFTYTPNANSNGEDQFTYLVRDGDGGVDEAVATITVNAVNDPPVITSDAALEIAENTSFVGVVAAEDVDGDDLTFAITGGADADLFAINASTGALSFKAAPDFETPQDQGGDNRHDVEVTATDPGGLSSSQALTVDVTNVNEAPAITSGNAFTLVENETSVGTITADDVDGDDLTFTITGGADADLFAINAATGALSFKAAPDFEAPLDQGGDNRHDLEVTATDPGGLSDTQSLTVVVTDGEEAPIITSGAAFTAAENQTIAGAITASDDKAGATFSITGGVDASLFSINAATGVLRFVTAPNFEAPSDNNADNTFDIEITVTDSDGLVATQAVSVRVTDVNDAPVAEDVAITGDEDTIISGALLASDEDGDVLVFALEDVPANGAVIVNADGTFTFIPDADFNGTDSFTFRASDGEASDTAEATISVRPVDEQVDPADPGNGGEPDDADDGGNQDDPADQDDPGDQDNQGDQDDQDNEDEQDDPDDPADEDDLEPPIGAEPPGDPVDPPAIDGPSLGDDLLIGTEQNDTINALAGDDTVIGLQGDDFLIGAEGNDQIRGDGGDDSIRGNAGADRLLGNGGDDDVRGNGGADVINGGGGADYLRGGGGGDFIRGGGGADLVLGNGGRDTVKAGGGADEIRGGGGADLLEGGAGRDTISGQLGDDTLQGGAGADVFQFRASDRNETIIDFRQGQDKIEIQSGARSFEDLSIEQDGRDVLIGFGVAGQVRVVTDNVEAFDESDFIF